MREFKVGDRVECIRPFANIEVGMTGKIVHLVTTNPPIGVHWNNFKNGNNCHGKCPYREGYFVHSRNIKLISATKNKLLLLTK